MNENSMNNAVTMRPDANASLGRIDQYELIRELGGGGFGCVYLARDTVAGIDVAVKGLPPLVRLNKEELENVRQNFALVSRLHHPNIAAALHLQKVEKAFYDDESDAEKLRVFKGDTLVVMQYAPGVTLSQWRKQFPEGKVPLDKAVEITRQIASALDYAHKERILHRDIKPANVMIETGADGSLTARVLDFGLAAEIRSSMSRVSQSITDTSGTRPYMAPEQWLGEKQGFETDQYSLAVLFYELITGEVPFVSVFDTGDPVLMMNVVGNREFNPSSELSKPIRLALTKALAKKREDRFESCIVFVDALVGRGVLTAPSGKAFGKIAAIGLLVLGLAGGVWYWQSEKAKEEARIVAEQKAEAERKAAEEARRIAEEKDKKEKVEAGRKKKEEAARETEALVADIMVEATVKKNQLLRIDDADGFERRKAVLSDLLTKATSYGKAKQWDKAALNFTNYVEGCNKLITLDGERKAAKEKQSAALVSQRQAANAESSKYASVRWGAASDVMKKASEHFSQMEFSEAKGFYESAANQFKLCISEAKNERERQVLEALATNPGQVLKKDLFTPKLKKYEWIYTEISRVQGELSSLLTSCTEEHPGVRAKRMKLNELLEQFVKLMEKDGLGDKARKALKSWAGSEGVIEKPSPDEPSYFIYEVMSGDSLARIAIKHQTTVTEICKLNKIRANFKLRVGQKLKIPINKSVSNKSVSKVQLWEGGPYWATKNIGAEKPEDSGYYFWWGDTVGYKREGDKWVASDGSNSNFEFLNTLTYGKSVSDLRSEGWIMADGVLSPLHDAVQKHWGGNWRMPTKIEFEDLTSKCDWRWTQVNGVKGYLVRGKGEYFSKSIFLPCAGDGYGTSLSCAGSGGEYWSSVPYSGSDFSWSLGFNSRIHSTYGRNRNSGRPVRPVQGVAK